MNKIKNSLLNILFSWVFIISFFIGTVMLPDKNILFSPLSANALINVCAKPQSSTDKRLDTLSKVLPVEKNVNPQKADTTPAPQYNTNVQVLASDVTEKIIIKNDTSYEIDVAEMLSQPHQKINGKVLILHTHTSEAYTKTPEYEYEESDSYRTQNSEKNIVAVGREIARILKENDIDVIHDETYHDYPSYTGSYRRCMETAQKNIAQYGDVALVLDVHRDALLNKNGEYMKTYANINGEEMAQALLVIGTNGSGLQHDNWKNNLKTALRLQKIMKEKYPPLARELHLCNERYNGHVSDGAMIIEVGSNGNTLSEAIKCAQLVGECIVSLIKD